MKEKIRKVVDVSDLNSLLESSEGLPITFILEHEGKDTELYCTGAFSTAGGRAVVLEFVKDRPEKIQRAYEDKDS